MKKHYPIVIEQDKDGVFIIECPAFEGCRSYGKTIDEALSNIREAIQVCIDEIDEDYIVDVCLIILFYIGLFGHDEKSVSSFVSFERKMFDKIKILN